MYFHDAGPEPEVGPRFSLAAWPYDEYWMGIVFNGARIGFSHLHVAFSEKDNLGIITAEMALAFHFMTIEKKITLSSWDRIGPDFSLREFRYDYVIDGSSMVQEGRIENGRLIVDVTAGGKRETRILALAGKVYPASAIGLLPVHMGLRKGKKDSYLVYEGQTQNLASVTQEIEAFEKSELFQGEAYRINTELLGQTSSMWIGVDGVPRLEISQGGVVISGLETQSMAKRYLVEGSLNKSDVFIDYSMVRSDRRIKNPRSVRRLEILFTGKGIDAVFPSDARQRCEPASRGLRCLVDSEAKNAASATSEDNAAMTRHLLPTHAVPSTDERIKGLASQIAGDKAGGGESVSRLLTWVEKNIAKKPVDAFSAVDVLEKGEGECQGMAFLYAAFARALGIPTRIVNGLVYSESHNGFLYHTWAESWVDGAWLVLDPTFGQINADATHIKIVEGETMADLTPLLNVVGRLNASVVHFE